MAVDRKEQNRRLRQARKLNEEARELLDAGGYDEAEALVDEIVSLLEGDSRSSAKAERLDALRRRALILGYKDSWETALAEHERLLAEFGGEKARALQKPIASLLVSKGFTLSQLDRSEEEIEVYDEVVRRVGDSKATALLERVAKALFNKGVTLGQLDRSEEAIAVYEEVVGRFGDSNDPALQRPVAKALFSKGVRLGALDRSEEAVAVYDEVMRRFGDAETPALREQVAKSLFRKGVCLGELDRSEGEIAAYDEVLRRFGDSDDLALRQQVAKALVNKGVVLLGTPNLEEAVTICERVVQQFGEDQRGELSVSVAKALLCEGLAWVKLEEHDEALKCFDRFDQLAEDADGALSDLVPVAFLLRRRVQRAEDPDDVAVRDRALDAAGSDQESQLRIYLEEIRRAIPPDKREAYFSSMKSSSERTDAFLVEPSRFAEEPPFLAVLREWNSYTPAVPAEEEQDRGGGYYMRVGGEGIVVDPGYDFVANFHRFGGRLVDIDHIIVTHAHDDHTAELENLLMLLFRRADKGEGLPRKRVSLYLSQDAQRKFSGILSLTDPNVKRLVTLCPGTPDFPHRIQLNRSVVLTVLPAYHEDVITCGHAVGLGFELEFGDVSRRIVFTSDSGIYPWLGKPADKVLDTAKGKALFRRYPNGFLDVDLLVVHIGSIKDQEFAPKVEDLGELDGKDCYYGKHLGLLGTLTMLDRVKADTAIVSEFGSELRTFHIELVEQMSKALHQKWRRGNPDEPRQELIVPGDLTILYNLATGEPFCHETRRFEPPEELHVCAGPDYKLTWEPATKRYDLKLNNGGRQRVYLVKSQDMEDYEISRCAEDAMHALHRYEGPIFRA